MEMTTHGAPQSNGEMEEGNSMIEGRVQSMLHDCGISMMYWVFAVTEVVYFMNYCTLHPVVSKTSYNVWRVSKPFWIHLHLFGWLAFVHVPNEK